MTLPPIPSHLPTWQAPHLAWLASQGHATRYAVPDGAEAVRANLRWSNLRWSNLRFANLHGADLREADLRGADLRGANLHGANLSGANLSGASLSEANLHGANLSGANLQGADVHGADLHGADLHGADLREADLRGADLRGANMSVANMSEADLSGAYLNRAGGIASIGPVGRQRRMVYAVANDDGPKVHAGCWFGSVDDTISRIEADYANDHPARERYVAAVRAVAALVTP